MHRHALQDFLITFICTLLVLFLAACSSDGGNATIEAPPEADSCVEVGSVANSGGGDVIIIANCTNGNGNVTQVCTNETSGAEVACPTGSSSGNTEQPPAVTG